MMEAPKGPPAHSMSPLWPYPPVHEHAWRPRHPLAPPSPAQGSASSLLSDVAALCAPGSRLVFDHLSEVVLKALQNWSAEVPLAGLENFAAAVASKGSPLAGGLPPSYSGGWVGLGWVGCLVRRFPAA